MKYTWLRIKRQPIPAVMVMLFSAVITVLLCLLHLNNLQARQHCQEVYDNIQLTCTVTNLSGDRTDGLQIGNNEVALFAPELLFFREEWAYRPKVSTELADLIEDVQIKASISVTIDGKSYTLAGITSWVADTALHPENGSTIFWREGFNESLFAGEHLVCLAPESLLKRLAATEEIPEEYADPALTTHIPLTVEADTYFDEISFMGNVLVAGSYSGKEGTTVYLPMDAYAQIMHATGHAIVAQSISATLKNNDDLERLQQVAGRWFAQPNPEHAGKITVDDLYLGIEIDDSRLREAQKNLESSLRVNGVAAAMILVLSAGAGFLVGALMVRNRKWEIALMRTMGTSDRSIYFSFVMEQMLCFVLGIIFGGAYNAWRPTSQLGILVVVFFVGLTIAVLIFLHKNLMTTIKEDD